MNAFQRILTCILAASVILIPAASGGLAQQKTSSQTVAPGRDGQHDFDFIFGSWKIHLKRRLHPLTGSTVWTEFNGASVYRKIWDGRANINEFEADSPTGHIEGLTLRTYNPQIHQWSLYWANSKVGILAVPQIGQFKNGHGEFYAQDKLDGKDIFVRYIWSGITRNSVHFEQSYSDDGGQTWEANWISDMSRAADGTDASDGNFTAAQTIPIREVEAAADQDGQHGFDPLIGQWKYHLKRRLNPLTGSNTWTDLEGTGACYKIWDGRAQLDTIEVDGPTGHIKGLTLRVYNPQSRQWRLYWANSKTGIIDPPQVGEFKSKHGEFFAQDTINNKTILIRYAWNLTTSVPHFEQSFSDDGGKTWEVNWITDQTRVNE